LGGFPNPYGILPDALSTGFALLGFPLTLGSAIAAATSMVLRLRRARCVLIAMGHLLFLVLFSVAGG
jgi:hypothetical protein